MRITKKEYIIQDGLGYYDLQIPTTHNYILMNGVVVHNCGTGVGVSVERQFINQLPVIATTLRKSKTIIRVEDSRIGWANAFRELLTMLYQGRIPEWDTSDLRPAGSKLKVFGGRSAGPAPLEDLFRFCVNLFKNAEGRKLNSIECHDICCKVGEIVVSGGVRRSALISLTNPSDDRMRYAKSGNWYETALWRKMANISAAYTEKPGMDVFFREWLALYESKSGERGIFNREAVKAHLAKNGRRGTNHEFLCNPCQPAFAILTTREGLRPLSSVDVGTAVWTGSKWATVIRKQMTGIKPVYEYDTPAGRFVGTSNHRILSHGDKVEVGNAVSIDRSLVTPMAVTHNPQDIMDGLVLGDGSVHKASNNLIYLCIGAKDTDYHKSSVSHLIGADRRKAFRGGYEVTTTLVPSDLPLLPSRSIPDRFVYGNTNKVAGFLCGLFSANGCVTKGRVQLKTTNRLLANQVQDMLAFLGIKSCLVINKPKIIRWPNGDYCSKQSYNIIIYNHSRDFMSRIGFLQQYKQHATIRDSLESCIASPIRNTKYLGDFEVYSITVDEPEHTYTTGSLCVANCGEILLRPNGQVCNLTEAIVRKDDNPKTLKEKVRLATIMGTLQATLTNFRYLRPQWKENTEEEALLGVSLTGVMDNQLMSGCDGKAELGTVLDDLRKSTIVVNKHWAKVLGINPAAAITTQKPSGTVSQLCDCASGIHPRFSDYYVRTVRADNHDPVTKLLKASGFPNEPDVTKPDHTTVFSFPIKSPDGAITNTDVDAISQLELWRTYHDRWAEHNISTTIYVKEHQWMEVGAWVYKHFDSISGVTFLPAADHCYAQAPYQEIDSKMYDALVGKMPASVDWSKLAQYEVDDTSVNTRELACSGEACELVDLTK